MAWHHRLTCDVDASMTSVPTQIIVGETCASHQPRGLSNDLGGVAIGVAVDAVEHLAVTDHY